MDAASSDQASLRAAEAGNNRGVALAMAGQLAEARDCLRQVLQLRPDFAQAHNNLALILKELGGVDDAVVSYRRAIALRPDFAEAHYNLSLLLLKQGQLEEGWQEYEWRWRTANLDRDRRTLPQPRWRGDPAPDRTAVQEVPSYVSRPSCTCRRFRQVHEPTLQWLRVSGCGAAEDCCRGPRPQDQDWEDRGSFSVRVRPAYVLEAVALRQVGAQSGLLTHAYRVA